LILAGEINVSGWINEPMKSLPPLLIATGFFLIFLGMTAGLYLILTRGQRRTMREIRKSAAGLGWRYRLSRWQGNPTAFRIDGQTGSGLTWILSSGNGSDNNRGWTVVLALRFPTLGGEPDFAVMPLDREGHGLPRGQAVPAGIESRIAVFSGAAAGDIAFLRDAREWPSGSAGFDAGYQVLAIPRRIVQPPVDPEFAARILQWPPDAVAPHSVLAWRDPFALHLRFRLPGPPNWSTVAYAAKLGEDLTARVPPPVVRAAPRGFVDQLVAWFLR
jgi:hypothetical protein